MKKDNSLTPELKFRKFLLKVWLKTNFRDRVLEGQSDNPSSKFHFFWCASVAFSPPIHGIRPIQGIRHSILKLLESTVQ